METEEIRELSGFVETLLDPAKGLYFFKAMSTHYILECDEHRGWE